jgi:hypothetical protein
MMVGQSIWVVVATLYCLSAHERDYIVVALGYVNLLEAFRKNSNTYFSKPTLDHTRREVIVSQGRRDYFYRYQYFRNGTQSIEPLMEPAEES